MKQAGVRTIVFGGRPQNGPMQGVGGTKGAQVLKLGETFPLPVLRERATQSLNTSTPLLTPKQLARWNEVVPRPLEKFPLVLKEGAINLLNNYSPDDSDTPLKFVYEAADCRRFFTAENIFNQEAVWASAAEAMFDGGACVPGSTNAAGSLFA